MTRQQFMAELTNLLGFMSYEDRERTIERYNRMFDRAEDEEEFMSRLGTPTKLAIRLAGEYVPTTPEEREEDERERAAFEQEQHELRGPATDAEGVQAAEPISAEGAEAENPAVPAAPAEDEACGREYEPEPEKPRRRRAKPGALVVYIILSLLIGLPVTVALVLVGLAVAFAGVGLGAGAVFAALELIRTLALFSDAALVAGAGLVICAVALVILWLGLWLSISLARLWIGGVLVRLGSRLCFAKEA